MYFSALGQPVIVLSSAQATTDLLLKKASVFSGRPYMAMVMDMWVVPVILHVADLEGNLKSSNYSIGWKASLVFANLGPAWNGQRKLTHQFLGPPAMPLHHEILESEAHNLVQRFVTEKKDFISEVT